MTGDGGAHAGGTVEWSCEWCGEPIAIQENGELGHRTVPQAGMRFWCGRERVAAMRQPMAAVGVVCGLCGGPVYMEACPIHEWATASECQQCGERHVIGPCQECSHTGRDGGQL